MNMAGYTANKKSLAGGQGQDCGWAGAVCWLAGAVMWPGRGRDAQKSLFQPISRHSDFRVPDLPSFLPTKGLSLL